MIKDILYLLKHTESDAEIVKIAKGKNKYPESFRELFKRLKDY